MIKFFWNILLGASLSGSKTAGYMVKGIFWFFMMIFIWFAFIALASQA